jgi:hypothetical protein
MKQCKEKSARLIGTWSLECLMDHAVTDIWKKKKKKKHNRDRRE